MARQLKQYYLATPIDFGMYNGDTIEEIMEKNGSYIKWCVLNVDYFYVAFEDLQEWYDNKGWLLSNDVPVILESKRVRLRHISAIEEERSWNYHDEMMECMNEARDHGSSSGNPWEYLFGPGEEANTAYWNTD